MTNPRVTVLMSVYNAERFVAQAVQSVLNQTFTDFEFLIFEDKSSDSSRQILRSFDDSRIRLVENTENRGLTRNLAVGMTMARGVFVARMDADDICMTNRLEKQLAYFDAHPEVSVLGSAVTFFDETGKEFVAHQPLEHEEIKCTLFFGFTMLHPSVMMRKSELEKHSLNYDPAFRVSQDHDLWTRAIRVLRFANLYEPLLMMREHQGKIGRNHKPLQQELSDLIRRRQLLELGLKPSAKQLNILGKHEVDTGCWTKVEFKVFDKLLIEIFEANLIKNKFDQRILTHEGISRFREICKQAILEGKSAGYYYWSSNVRCFDNRSVKMLVKLMVCSILSFIRK